MGSFNACNSNSNKFNETKSIDRRCSNSTRFSDMFVMTKKLKIQKLNFQIEVSADDDFVERKNSAEWFFKQLEQEEINFERNYKIVHKNKGDFCVCIVRGYDRKIIFSSDDSHKDTVIGSLINENNYILIIDNLVNFLDESKLITDD